jgi:heat shock protein HtpX
MDRYEVPGAPRATELSRIEQALLCAGVLLVITAVVVAFFGSYAGGVARTIGSLGLAGVAICATLRGVRLYQAGMTASLPTSVARVHVRVRPARAFNVSTVTLALALPFAACVVVLALVYWAWLLLVGVLLLGGVAMFATREREAGGKRPYAVPAPAAADLLQRLCMRADMRPPELIVEHDAVANCWTAGGRIQVTTPLLKLLDDAELEAVLAHEVAHLAHRDAAVMEICSAPSRVLLAFARYLPPRLVRWVRGLIQFGQVGAGIWFAMAILAVLCVPPALVIGWISRLSVLGMSREREFSADAAAATLTGRPSALASALLKLEHQRDWTPRSDLRQFDADAVLCIVGIARPRLGRLLSTHPPTAARVKRLEETEIRIQAASHPARLWE